MRLWSLHPKYLDAKGLVALWREALLAKKVLEGKTAGYQNHPQLIRFRKSHHPLHGINRYLSIVYEEALKRGYHFNRQKINRNFGRVSIYVTRGQMNYERDHLLRKLKLRDKKKYRDFLRLSHLRANPIFKIKSGRRERWEKITS